MKCSTLGAALALALSTATAYAQAPSLDRAGGEPALSVEMGRGRRARLDEPPEAGGRA